MSISKITTLSNGLRVITDVVTSVESVAIGVWAGVGTRNEDLKINGAAHMVEHMLFKGTKKRDALEIAEVIENVGGNMNAYTSREMTSYYIHLLKDDLPLALEVLSDMVQNSIMPEEEIERERGVILQEIGMCHDTPDDIIFDHYFETAYPKQALGAPILGTTDIIQLMSRESLMGYVDRFYTPSQLILCVSGNFDEQQLIKMAEDKFSDLPSAKPHEDVEANYQGGEFRETRELEQSHVIMGFKGVSQTDENYYAAQILTTILGGGMSSRLFQEIREKRGLVYSVYSFHSAYKDDGQLGIYAGTGPEKLPELIPVMCDEVLKIGGSIQEQELQRAKAQLKSSTLMARESMMSRADQNAKSMILRGCLRTIDEIINAINAVTIDDLDILSKQIFSGTPTLAALGPLDQLEDFEKIKERLVA